MKLVVMVALTVAWYAVAEVTGWKWAYGVMMLHAGVMCAGAESMV